MNVWLLMCCWHISEGPRRVYITTVHVVMLSAHPTRAMSRGRDDIPLASRGRARFQYNNKIRRSDYMLFPDLLVTNIVILLLQTVPLKLPAFRGRSIVPRCRRHQGCCIVRARSKFDPGRRSLRAMRNEYKLLMASCARS